MPAPDRPFPKITNLWKQLSAERRLEAARAFWTHDGDPAVQAEAVEALARHLKFRPKSVLGLPVEKRARYLCSLPVVSDSIAVHLLVAHHLAAQRPMMAAFLDALGVPHKEGLITTDDITLPDAKACRRAARALMEEFPEPDAMTYFSTLLVQDPETWAPLRALVS